MYGSDAELRPVAFGTDSDGGESTGPSNTTEPEIRDGGCVLGGVCGVFHAVALVKQDCELVIAHHCHFAFTCKPNSHTALYQEIDLLTQAGGVSAASERHWNGRHYEIWDYRFASRVLLRADTKPLYVNWCEVTVTNQASGELVYHNAWATDHPLSDARLHRLLNLLAFLFHTALDLCDEQYRRIRTELGTRQTFFQDIQALTRYLYFGSWQVLITFMFTRLELDPDLPASDRKRMRRR